MCKKYSNNNTKIAYMQGSDENLLHLGEYLRNLRKKRKLTLENICYKNGLEPSTLSRIEQGKVDAKYLTLMKLANAYDMKISQLLDF